MKSCYSRLYCAAGFMRPSTSWESVSENFLVMAMGPDCGGRLPCFDSVGEFCVNFAWFVIRMKNCFLKYEFLNYS